MSVTVDLNDLTELVHKMDSVKTKTLNSVGDFIIKEAKRNLQERPDYNGTGKLGNSLTKTINGDSVSVSSNLKYADIQNTGGKIKITDKMRKFFWHNFYKTGKEMWRNLAITKKTHVTIPEQPYLEITNLIESFALSELENNFKKLK